MNEFDKICHSYTPIVFRFLLSLCGDEDLANELTAETFYQAYLHIDTFRGECRIETWLCQIAKNALYKESKRKKRTIQWDTIPDIQTTDDIFDAIADKDQALKIHKCLHRLNDPYREVFTLRILGELSFKEISDIFGKTESWAKVTFYRAKNKLIEAMEENYERKL